MRTSLLLPALVSLSLNGIGLVWAAVWLTVGGLGVGLSSTSTAELKETWNSFVYLAACLPILVNFGGLLFALIKQGRSLLAGWMFGLLAVALLGIAAGGGLTGIWFLVNASARGF